MDLNIINHPKRGIIAQFTDTKVLQAWSNFGTNGRYSNSLEVYFIIDDDDFKNQLLDEGFNVRVKTYEDMEPLVYLKAKISYNDWYQPRIILVDTEGNRKELGEDQLSILDRLDIIAADADVIRAKKQYEISGNKGYAAYLDTIKIYYRPDRFAD